MKIDSKTVDKFLATEKGKAWMKSFPDYFSEYFKPLAAKLITKLLNDFAEYCNKK